MATIVRPVQPSAKLPVSTLGIARRSLLKFLRTPQLVVLGTIQGAMFLLIFRYVFGGAIGAGGMDYVNFLVPGFVTTGILFSGMGAATGVAEDLEQGFVDRLRSLPIPRSAVLAGRALADTAQAAQGLALLIFPLTFVSSAYVPVATMPGWLQAPAEHQPMTVMVDAVRALTQGPAAEAVLGHDAGYYVVRSLLWAAAIVVVFAPLAVARYRRG